MRAPPELETSSSGMRAASAASQARTNFSPTALPIEPPRKAKSMTASSSGMPVELRRADDDCLAKARC